MPVRIFKIELGHLARERLCLRKKILGFVFDVNVVSEYGKENSDNGDNESDRYAYDDESNFE